MKRVRLIGGPYDGHTATITETPPVVELDGTRYVRLDDPDTGEFLGGYAVENEWTTAGITSG